MRLLGLPVLDKALRRHPDARTWIEAWIVKVEDADWQSLSEVRMDYPSVDGVKLKSRIVVTVFNVKGNEYRLLTSISYQDQLVSVLDLMTHAEYSKDRWKGYF